MTDKLFDLFNFVTLSMVFIFVGFHLGQIIRRFIERNRK